MYLKSIEIVGYKSFAAKTRVELEPGITGIIGPNGCGKSNIMESVRWCLGEMSWKSLRADSMIDVIFAGTAKRAPLSMTEVTLVFDNAKSLLPVQFSEVTVSRRIFRSGESEYYLNKTQCRLRDIRELFLDTGIGGDGYAIIDQGGVDFVLSSKPEDRRALFEEAAGVAKYKAKREEALRKLERVEMDMGRLQDSVSLIEEQVKKLDSDARKAKLYQKYKAELSAMEAGHILEQLGAIRQEMESLSALSRPLEESLGARRTEMNAEGAHLSALKLEHANQQNQVIGCNQKISEIKSQSAVLNERLEQADQALSGVAQRRGECETELSSSRERLSGIDPEIDRAKAELTGAQEQLAAAQREVDEWQGQVARVEAEIASAQAELESLRAQALKAAEDSLALRRRCAALESDWTRQEGAVRQSLRDLEKDLSQTQSSQNEIDAARAQLEGQQALAAQARGAAQACEAELADLRRRQSESGDSQLRLHAELAQARAKYESLQTQGEQNPYWVGAQTVINAGISGVVGTVRQMIRVGDAYKPYLEDALGERLYAVVCEDSSAARAGVELLNASGKGRARFLVLSSIPDAWAEKSYPEESRPLIRHLEFDPGHEKAVRYLLQETYALDKALFGDHWVYGGAVQKEGVQLGLADVEEFRARIASCEERQAQEAAQKAQLEASVAQAEVRLREAAGLHAEESAKEHAVKGQLEQKQVGLELSLQNVDISTEESARLLAAMALTKEEIHQARSAATAADAREAAAREQEQASRQAISGVGEALARGRAAQDSLRSKVEGFESQISFLAKTFDRLAIEKEGLDSTVARREQELLDLAQRKEETLSRQAQSREQLARLGGELGQAELEAQSVFSRLQELEKSISEKDQILRALKEQCDRDQEQLHQHELKASAHRSRQDLLTTRLWDEWQLTFEEAKSKFEGQAVDAEKIEALRKRLANMGNINMAAPEEYEALSSRQNFLATQIADLNKAKEDLKSAIQKINASTRENFRQTFTEVREQFRRLYGVLFEGGEADLLFTDPENILETGIEIVAQPPGKRLQSISLLSGGEKTLTAIALLFAFFMVKPSPFCMLDEADAALDDANVERFVSLLREFQARSQFLIVSHNKRTMEAADVIYGVTMEEMGVSQLVSVDFRKKSAAAPQAAPVPLAAAGGPESAPPQA